ncbi:MAG: amidase [Rhodobacteraceae bacterium]|nr:amidase [Paracoccaceae bacterium]
MSITRRSACDLVDDLSAGRLSARDLMAATLDRIAEVNPEVNAIVALRDADALMAEAEALDRAGPRGPLHGLPIAVKDLANVRGIVTSQGSPIHRDTVAAEDDLIVARMRNAGAILIGKTNVPEFGLGSHTFNPVYGHTSNPYDRSRTCGGSSGGAAVALATGMTALADGSDMMGSLRNPATWNNVYGFRPTWGRVDGGGPGDRYLHRLSTLGPMGRSPEDIALFLDVLARGAPFRDEPGSLPPVSPIAAADLRGKRIGWLGTWGDAMPFEPGIIARCRATLDCLADLGASVTEVDPPFDAEAIFQSWCTLRSWQIGASLKHDSDHRDMMKDSAQWELARGEALSAFEVHDASVVRSDWLRCAEALFEKFDALVLPGAQIWPFPVDIDYPRSINDQPMDTYHRWMHVMVPVSLIGLPALAMPSGFGENGLPMGVQIFGRMGADADILAIGAAYHAATQWPQNRPAMA